MASSGPATTENAARWTAGAWWCGAGPAELGAGPAGPSRRNGQRGGLEELGELRLFLIHNPLTHKPRRSAYLAGQVRDVGVAGE